MSGESKQPESESTEEGSSGFKFVNTGLNKRCNDVFANLDALEKKHKAFEVSRAMEDADLDKRLLNQAATMEEVEASKPDFKKPTVNSGRDYHSNKPRYRNEHDDRGDPQEFRKPMPPSQHSRGRRPYRGRGRPTPDYKVNPERWTEYSLRDVDTSDSSMKQAAFEFLNERKRQREGEMKEERIDVNSTACSSGLFTFNRPVKNKEDSSSGSKKKSHSSDARTKHERYAENDDEYNDVDGDDISCEKGSRLDFTQTDSSMEVDDSSKSASKRKADFNEGEEISARSRPELDISSLEESCENKEKDIEKPTGFKSRKSVKKSFRAREKTEDNEDE